MQTFYDQRGHELRLESKLGEGAEGAVYRVQGATRGCVKILERSRRTLGRRDKIQAMIEARPCNSVMQASTWPMATVYEDPRCTRFAGFVMARVDMKSHDELHTVWDTKSPYGFAERATIALNLAAVIAEVHAEGHRVGDLRERNVLVNRRCEIILVDCDSFEVRARDGKIFYSGLGAGDYLPPELLTWMDKHNTGLAGVERYYSDLFALAVLIFQLFMNGARPYTARGPGITTELGPPKAKVIAGTYPYVNTGGRYMPPKFAPPMILVPPTVQDLLAKAFVVGHTQPDARPSAAQWRQCLAEVASNMRQCAVDRGHTYGAHLGQCPWCGTIAARPGTTQGTEAMALASQRDNFGQTLAIAFGVFILLLVILRMQCVP